MPNLCALCALALLHSIEPMCDDVQVPTHAQPRLKLPNSLHRVARSKTWEFVKISGLH